MVHTEDRVDPVADMEIIHHELRLKDIERMTGILAALQKVSPQGAMRGAAVGCGTTRALPSSRCRAQGSGRIRRV